MPVRPLSYQFRLVRRLEHPLPRELQRHSASTASREGFPGHSRRRTSALAPMDEHTRQPIRHGVKRRLDGGAHAKAFPSALVGEVDLEDDAPVEVLPAPLDDAALQCGLHQVVAVGLHPEVSRELTVQDLIDISYTSEDPTPHSPGTHHRPQFRRSIGRTAAGPDCHDDGVPGRLVLAAGALMGRGADVALVWWLRASLPPDGDGNPLRSAP